METETIATTPVGDLHREAGARFAVLRGSDRPADYGAPDEEYREARESAAVIDRSHRAFWRIRGRDPARMLDGLVTNGIPEPVRRAEGESGDVLAGRGAYGAVLSPKGKLIADHRLFRWGGESDDDFLLEVPPPAVPGLKDHFGKFLPPRFATVDEAGASRGQLTLVGPRAPDLVSGEVLGGALGPEVLASLDEDEFRLLELPGLGRIRVVRCGTVPGPAFDLQVGREGLGPLWERIRDAGVRAMGFEAWERLRVEAGRPAFGTDMDDGTIPVEAGIHDRAIDYEKGCYTGQEVIVRIRDRGRVNRHLRGLRFGDLGPPDAGAELFRPDGDRSRGRVTSAVRSPRFGETIGLGYVRREIEPPATVHLGGPDGPPVRVSRLVPEAWRPDDG